MKLVKSLAVLGCVAIAHAGFAQETSNEGLNPLSLRPVHESNIAKKETLWRRIDLNEKQNQPLFAKGNEITKHLIDGVKAGILDAYSDETLTERLTLDEFNGRMFKQFEGGGLSQEEIDAGFGNETTDDGWGATPATTTEEESEDDGWGTPAPKKEKPKEDNTQMGTQPAAPAPAATAAAENGYEMFPNEFYILELKEDWIFDRQRSRQYYDIQTVTIKIPAEASNDGLEKTLASFKYKDLEQFFRSNPNAVWFNEANTAKHLNLADAFELRLFHGRIIKVSNALDKYLDEMYGSAKEALFKSQEIEYKLLEWEHNLWEY